jgi:hypothetical protein
MSLPTNLKSDDVVQVTSRLPRQAVVGPPHLKLGNLTAQKSDQSGCAGLSVRVCDLPLCAHFISMERSENAYHFYYRPRPAKGDLCLTIPAFGVVGRRNSRDDLLLVPPGIRVEAEWKSAAGSIATFFLKPCFIKDIAERARLSAPYLEKALPGAQPAVSASNAQPSHPSRYPACHRQRGPLSQQPWPG